MSAFARITRFNSSVSEILPSGVHSPSIVLRFERYLGGRLLDKVLF